MTMEVSEITRLTRDDGWRVFLHAWLWVSGVVLLEFEVLAFFQKVLGVIEEFFQKIFGFAREIETSQRE